MLNILMGSLSLLQKTYKIELTINLRDLPIYPPLITKINQVNLARSILDKKIKNLKALKSYNEILIEEYIPGREIQVAIMDNKSLGAIELEPKRKFYDYEAKYNSSAKTKHLIPVDLSKNNLAKITGIARAAHKIIGCKGVTRSDFKFFNGKFYLLEINTQPGMTKLSLVPEIAKHKGISFIKLIEWILKDASVNR